METTGESPHSSVAPEALLGGELAGRGGSSGGIDDFTAADAGEVAASHGGSSISTSGYRFTPRSRSFEDVAGDGPQPATRERAYLTSVHENRSAAR